ncbi:DUF3102 domain-containing protein [Schinkia azotoformans]|uniref:DUF3102 domain-containing protein n=1 Tax=Schinkia azotoformans TaxID=1454 RepID=UPI002DB735AD|nr:DUF3102 domain-containing protein [Schinkia azotoformans]MEC1716633.1 DUF3102 domain-containing protein [Schinkia azotoformans]MEC1739472.1 DUF3102 domain-containing protein [Schinkia azotoformans]MEC1745458.1 DUF3102 domain-containing protein [Schinkia azotoformans]MEC1756521.1 DUF3102 domain-containing protein [Schinkia azotoformans]MEC1765788.1 DUF3102 domain-containing protein [Schinkia azotoformans]
MNQLTDVRTPDLIALEINSIKGQTRAVLLHSSIEIGKRLVEAKELVAHGQWGGWLESNVDYSQSTANNLMQIYREYGEDPPKIPTLGNLSYTKALALLGVPEEEREQFVAENDVENMSAKELQKVIKEKQKLEKELEKKDAAAEKEKVKLQKNIDQLRKQLEEANEGKVDEEEVKRMQIDLAESQIKIQQLEADLKAKPIEAATVEVIPEEVEKELSELREKVNQQGDPGVLTFRLRFESLVEEFQHLLKALDSISDEGEREKYKTAVNGLIEKMKERL